MKNLKKYTLSFLMIMLLFTIVSCGFNFKGHTLVDGTVGVEYKQSIDYVTGTENEVEYSLKENSLLPQGLKLEDGSIVGIPEEAVKDFDFTVIAKVGKTKKEATFKINIHRGKIAFEDATVDIIVGKENSGTINIAKGAVNIKYEIIEGSENLFEGLSIREDGQIVGIYDRTRTSRPIKIKATAKDADEAIANIQIRAINPYLTYKGGVLADARVGLNYAASVATIEEKSVQATYKLHPESKLPVGLELKNDGTIVGIPTIVGPGETFKVIVSASDYSDSIAEFKIDVILNHVSSANSKIINFGKENSVVELTAAFDGEFYVNQNGIIGNAAALNNNAIKYTLMPGSKLPEGLVMYENGAIIGFTNDRNVHTFSVKASAEGCEDVIREFRIVVQGSKIKFESQNILMTRGENTNISIATATTGDNSVITYSMTEDAKKQLLDTWGLTLSEDGIITGIPKKSVKSMNFAVTVSAEGYSSTTASIFVNIQEPLTQANRFEAEYTSLIGKNGTGYSGAPTEENMITYDASAGNGHFVNYLHNDTITLEFIIWAETATSNAKLYVSLGSELGNITLNPNSFGIYVYDSADINTGNKTKIDYSPITVTGGNQVYNGFYKLSIGNISLVEGYNTIQLCVHSNTLKNGSTGGPGIDYIEIETSTKLMWHPSLYNLNK